MIDVGGPSMLRAAAKNFAYVVAGLPARAVRARPRRAARAAALGSTRGARSRREAFATTAAYDAAIAALVRRRPSLPGPAHRSASRRSPTSRTARTRTSAPRTTRELGARRHLLSRVEQLGGKELSYNNLADLEARAPDRARVRAAGRGDREAREPVRRRDRRRRSRRRTNGRSRPTRSPRSAACSSSTGRSRASSAGGSRSTSSRCCSRPSSSDEALEALRAKTALRLLRDRERRAETPGERDYKRVLGGLLVQERDVDVDDRSRCASSRGSVYRGAVGRPRSSPGASAST